jgi:hypothetical protein
MKTLKTSSHSEKVSLAEETEESKRLTISISKPEEEDIRKKARELYYHRNNRDEESTAENDWFKSENYFRGDLA